jgi:hypothetical protein
VKQIRKRLTYANVMSSIAVFLVLGGATAIAANQLGKNSVGSKQLKKNAVTAAKINLSTLGTVPNATHAGSADTAGNANTVGGSSVNKVFAKFPANSTTTLGTFGAFKFVATCDGSGNVVIEVDPQTADTDYAASGNGFPYGAFYARDGGVEPNS